MKDKNLVPTKKPNLPITSYSGLSARQEKFCQLYSANGFDAGQAALDAGFSHKEYGNTLIKKEKVWLRIQTLMEPALRVAGIHREKLLLELKELKDVDVSEIVEMDNKGNIIGFKKDGLEKWGRTIKSISAKKDGMKIDFHDKSKVLEILLRTIGAEMPKKVDVKVGPDAEAFAAWEREKQRVEASDDFDDTDIVIDIDAELIEDEKKK